MIYFRKPNILFFLFLLSNLGSNAQKQKDSIFIEAKVWSRDSNRNIVYSDWKKFPTATIENLNGFVKSEDKLDEYGGFTTLKSTATGFFRTEKINNRWWVIDPVGNAFIVKAVNSIKIGTSPNNKIAFDSIYKTGDNWIFQTYQQLKNIGFNSSGSWSEVELIRNMNETRKTHFVYTTQLNILSDFAKTKEKKSDNV